MQEAIPPLSREDLEDVIFKSPSVRRYTQDSLILPDVWFEFGRKGPDDRVELLMVPYRNESKSPGDIAGTLRDRGIPPDAHIAYHQSATAAALTFRELVAVVLPLGPWRREFWSEAEGWQQIPRMGPGERARIARALIAFEQGSLHDVGDDADSPSATSPLVLWTLRLVGTIQLAHEGHHDVLRDPQTAKMRVPLDASGATAIVDAAASLIDPDAIHERMIYSVSLNRDANISVYRSVSTVKADAARRLFEIDATGLRWAVIDSGIDATHPAFRRRKQSGGAGVGPMLPKPFTDAKEGNNTRVIATYDFTPVRELLDVDLLRKAVDGIRDHPPSEAPVESPLIPKAHLAANLGLADALITTLARGLPVSWGTFAPLLQIPHVEGLYRPPRNEHGTHVAGILAGDWRTSDEQGRRGYPPPDNDLIGVCPNLELYDLRVLDDKGHGHEFAVMAALQFVRALNTEADYLAVHGVNLSMSIRHDVANYACGRTPICEEAARLVATGATVVAAAGNEGYARNPAQGSGLGEGYRSISITDPGNAEDVITVGATHGYRPLTYGVSYFSSRGPTGDGRRKPDVVAPGEKIWSAVPDGGARTLDGTSMAAPHVSGCAALLMARHRELIGDPVRVKRVLCGSATDLGREPYFQGHGLVDILRAIQSM